MDNVTLRNYILEFLKDFKELIYQGSYYVTGHLKNIEALSTLGITIRQRDDYILSLSLEDYCDGPCIDKLKDGHYWEFGKNVDNVEVYIKLKIINYKDGSDKGVCYSFHPAEKPQKYPLLIKVK